MCFFAALLFSQTVFAQDMAAQTHFILTNEGIPGVLGNIESMVRVGEKLYVGGEFHIAGNTAASNFAVWDGKRWSALGAEPAGAVEYMIPGRNGNIFAMVRSYRDGLERGIYCWDGSRWNGIDIPGDREIVTALAVDQTGALIAGISSYTNGGWRGWIGRWADGTWNALGEPMKNCFVKSLVIDGGRIFAGGYFSLSGTEGHVILWDGLSWSVIGRAQGGWRSSYPDLVSLALDGKGNLYAGGDFSGIGDTAATNFACWDGKNWSSPGQRPLEVVRRLFSDEKGRIYVSPGNPDVEIPFIHCWDGSGWKEIPAGMNGPVKAMVVDGDEIYAGGEFNAAGGTGVSGIARWDGKSWSALGTGLNGPVYALTSDVQGRLFAGGNFQTAGGQRAFGVAVWDEASWRTLTNGLSVPFGEKNIEIRQVVWNHDRLAAVWKPEACESGGWVSLWNGKRWGEMSSMGDVYSLVFDGKGNLFSAGAFEGEDEEETEVSPRFIARWNGKRWSETAPGLPGPVYGLALDSQGKWVACVRSDGSEAVSEVMRWDGKQWRTLGGLKGYISGVKADRKGRLYVYGESFSSGNGSEISGIAVWNGKRWESAGFDGSIVTALTVDEKGLVIAASTDGKIRINRSPASSGAKWEVLMSVDGEVHALELRGNVLYLGGNFMHVGGVFTPFIAGIRLPEISNRP